MNTLKVNPEIEPHWKEGLKPIFESEEFLNLKKFLIEEKAKGKIIFPESKNIFKAFDLCPLPDVQVVILGQDPYHGENQAHGLCFSVLKGTRIPRSLYNIFKELKSDLGISIPNNGDLSSWASQGILLLNSVLTVESGKAGSHQKKGWEQLTSEALSLVNEKCKNVVFLLWGKWAQNKAELLNPSRHLILKAAHPVSRPSAHNVFFGCKHFSKTNDYLLAHGKNPIKWQIPSS